MLYTVKSNVDIKIIKDEIVEKAKEVGFGVLKEYPFKDILQEKGHPIEQDITVYELCNPAAANKVLSKHPEFSIYLPCRISLYEENGHAIISTIGIDEMIKNFDVDDDLKAHMNEVYKSLKTIIHNWK